MENDPINDLRSGPLPPADLERRVLSAVRAQGAIRERVGLHRAWKVAAAAAIFIAGVSLGRLVVPSSATGTQHSRAAYLLLLAGDVAPGAAAGTRAEEYGAWAQSVSATGVSIRGSELSPAMRLVGAVEDTPLARELDSVGGYFIVEVETEAEAVRLAETCPHVKHGGIILIRKLI